MQTAMSAGIVLVAFFVRCWRLDSRPLWFDEGYSIYFAGVSPLEAARLTASDIHPPFYYWALQLWTLFVGWYPVSVRFFSVWVGILTVAVMVAAGSKAGGRGVGLTAALVLAVAPIHVAYSQEVRMYVLLALFSSLAMAFWLDLDRGGKRAVWGYGLSAGAALLTQYYAAFLVAGHVLSLVHRPGRRRRAAALTMAITPSLAWAAYAGPSLLNYVRTKVAFEGYQPLSPVEFASAIVMAFSGTGPGAYSTAALLVVGCLAGLVGGRFAASSRLALALGLAGPLFLGWLVNLVSPFHPESWERLYLYVLPFFMLGASGGLFRVLDWLRRPQRGDQIGRSAGLLATLAVGAVYLGSTIPGIVAFYTRDVGDDPRPMVRLVSTLGRPEDLLIAVYPWQIGYFRLYASQSLPEMVLSPSDKWSRDSAARVDDLTRLAAGHDRVWVPAYQKLGRALELEIESHLDLTLYPVSETWFGDHRLLFYGKADKVDRATDGAKFGGLTLQGARIGGVIAESGYGVIAVDLDWEVPRYSANDVEVHLRLADERGLTWGQHDGPLNLSAAVLATAADHHGLLVPAGTPPGDYRLLLSLTKGSGPISAEALDGRALGAELTVGRIHVVAGKRPPPVAALFIGRNLGADLGDGLTLLGASVGPGPYRLGETALVTLFWQSSSSPTKSRLATLRVGESALVEPIGGRHPMPSWHSGELVREIRPIPIRGNGPSLDVKIEVDGAVLDLGSVNVIGRQKVMKSPEVAFLVGATFGQNIQLVGVNLSSHGVALAPGMLARDLDVDLVWYAASQVEENFSVFVHLTGPDGRPVVQHDGPPVSGDSPTAGWSTGEYLVDRHTLEVPPRVPSGQYRLVVGLYRPADGLRLPVRDSAGRSIGDSVVVVSSAGLGLD